MFEAMDRGELTSLYVLGENPLQSEADRHLTERRLMGLDLLVVQDIFLTATAEIADVVLPAAAAWAESEGTVTNSERRVQRVRKALEPPGEARDDLWILFELARRLGHDWGEASAERGLGRGARDLAGPRGMSYARLEAEGGLQWPCYDENHPGELFLHSRLWEDPVPGNRAPFVPVEHDPPVDKLTDDFPMRLTTGRRLDSYNTGVQSGGYNYPRRKREALDLSPEDIARMGLVEGERVRIVSRRGEVEAPVRVDPALRPGLAFMTFHFQDEVQVNNLTIDATDPKSGTAEFKATAIRVEKLPAPGPGLILRCRLSGDVSRHCGWVEAATRRCRRSAGDGSIDRPAAPGGPARYRHIGRLYADAVDCQAAMSSCAGASHDQARYRRAPRN